ncbi:MAG: spermidine/putrescine ABC transporter substrate-binding protein [Clostridia bacterium]|nr:spermidine/putrescine ABC transporter substrate-binding protein [Clostridia bacterium]
MKRIVFLLILALLLPFSLCACSPEEEVGTLNVYNWGEYIDDEILDVNEAFYEETGIKVNYKTFDSNESMYTLISTGAADYDVVFPSDYMVGRMIKEGLLAELNFDNIPNYQYIDERYRHLEYDPEGKYSVPYMWGTVGIFYNKKYVTEEEMKASGWDILWSEKYKGKIYMFDNPRDAFAISQLSLGYSLNTTDPKELHASYEKLLKQKPVLQGYYMDQIYQKMLNEEGWLAPYYAGDAALLMYGEDANENIGFYIPESGTNLFVDAACVLKNSKHKKEAEMYINFLCKTEVALANAEYVGYSTPHTEARAQLDPEISENPIYYPAQSVLDKSEVFLTLPEETNKLMSELWIKLKTRR